MITKVRICSSWSIDRVLLKTSLVRAFQIQREADTKGFVWQPAKEAMKALAASFSAQAGRQFRGKIEVDLAPLVRLAVVLLPLLLSPPICLPRPFRICAQEPVEPGIHNRIKRTDLL